jgi:hypothetical protein
MSEKYKECGEIWAIAQREREATEAHDREHSGDPAQYWGECERCAEYVQMDIDEHLRCKHGLKAGTCGPCEVALDKAIDADAFPNK